ncbi:MAG: Ku protein, partial [Candidatus Doudnabacteria bacterium]|nr:Ku protein [Candidatus Doudnabacteria bacterium]
LEQVRYKDELRDAGGLNLPKGKSVDKKEIHIALSLIEKLTEHFKPENYTDTYQKELKKVINAKAKGKKFKTVIEKEPEPTEVTDIIKLLKASLEREKVRA